MSAHIRFIYLLVFLCYLLGGTGVFANDTLEIKKHNSLGSSYLFSNPDSAKICFRDALSIAKKSGNDTLYLKQLQITGSIHSYLGSLDSAEVYFQKGIQIATKLGQIGAVSASTINLGNVLILKGKYSKAISYHLNALKLIESSNDRALMATSLYCIGVIYFESENYIKGQHYFNLSLKESTAARDTSSMLNCLVALSAGYNKLGLADSALYVASQADILVNRSKSTGIEGHILTNKAEAYLQLKHYNEALKCSQNALAIFKRTQDITAAASCQLTLSKVLIALKETKQAEKNLQEALLLSTTAGLPKIKQEIYKELSEVYATWGDHAQALSARKEYESIKDSLFNITNSRIILDLQEQYQSEKREKQIASLQVSEAKITIQEAKTRTIATVLAIIILGIAVFLLQYIRWNKKKTTLELEKKQIESESILLREKDRIARELHDNIGSRLSFMVSHLELTELRMKSNSENNLLPIQELSSQAQETINELRDSIWSINLKESSGEELKSKILEFIAKVPQTFKPEEQQHLKWNLPTQVHFLPLVAINILRIIQESINNATKYSKATALNVSADVVDGFYQFQVHDNGQGITSESKQGHGLKNMKFRASEIGGDLSIVSNEQGTQITLTVPIQN